MMNISLGKQHPTSELAKTVKTEKDAERCRFKMIQARPRVAKGEFGADAFEKATLQFVAHYYKPTDLYTHRDKKEVKQTFVPVGSDPKFQHKATHRLSQKQAHLFREFQYSAGMLKREVPTHDGEDSTNFAPSQEDALDDVRLSSVQAERKPEVVRLPSHSIPEHETAEFVEVNTDTSLKRQSFKSDTTAVSKSSGKAYVHHSSDPVILKRINGREDYADESTWRTASAIMRAHNNQHFLPSRNVEWPVLPEARRPKTSGLRRSSAQRIPNHMKRSNSMKRQRSSNANI